MSRQFSRTLHLVLFVVVVVLLTLYRVYRHLTEELVEKLLSHEMAQLIAIGRRLDVHFYLNRKTEVLYTIW